MQTHAIFYQVCRVDECMHLLYSFFVIAWTKMGAAWGNETPEIGFKVTILRPTVDQGFVASGGQTGTYPSSSSA